MRERNVRNSLKWEFSTGYLNGNGTDHWNTYEVIDHDDDDNGNGDGDDDDDDNDNDDDDDDVQIAIYSPYVLT